MKVQVLRPGLFVEFCCFRYFRLLCIDIIDVCVCVSNLVLHLFVRVCPSLSLSLACRPKSLAGQGLPLGC